MIKVQGELRLPYPHQVATPTLSSQSDEKGVNETFKWRGVSQ